MHIHMPLTHMHLRTPTAMPPHLCTTQALDLRAFAQLMARMYFEP